MLRSRGERIGRKSVKKGMIVCLGAHVDKNTDRLVDTLMEVTMVYSGKHLTNVYGIRNDGATACKTLRGDALIELVK